MGLIMKIVAGIFLIRKDNKLLVCHPTHHKPDFWSISKGRTEEDEEVLTAAIRETFEETNINLKVINKIYPLDPIVYKKNNKILYPFVLLERDNNSVDFSKFDLKCNSMVSHVKGDFPEMDDYKYVTLEEAKSLLHETQVACLDAISKIVNG